MTRVRPIFAPARVALLGALLFVGACGGAGEPRPNALVVTLDTTRADAVGPRANGTSVTPVLDRLAAEGVAFGAARTVTPITLPAHVSMFTGLYPPRHGIRDNELWSLPEAAETLAERASAAGYQTAAFVAAPVLDRTFGLAQGFEVWSQPDRSQLDRDAAEHGHTASLPAEVLVDRALEWFVGRDRARPFLAWVHLYDPHLPLAPPPRFLRQAGGDPYLGEVARVDHAVGRLLEALEAEDELDRTAVLVVGDHGEGNGDHGEATHGTLVYDSTLRVPFVVRPPRRASSSVAELDAAARLRPVSVVDLAPTAAGLLGLGFAEGVDGRDLFGAPEPDRGVYFESYHGYLHYGWSPIAGWIDARGKYVHSPRPQLFEPDEDAREQDDRIASASPQELAPYLEALANVTVGGVLESSAAATDRELLEGIRALGYAGGGSTDELPDPLAPSDRPSPHDSVDELDAIGRAADLGRAGDHDGALAAFRAVLRTNPGNTTALAGVAYTLLEAGRPAEAVEPFERLVASSPRTARYHASRGAALEALGQHESALASYERAAELDPGDSSTLRSLARQLQRAGQTERADQVRARIAELER